MIVSGDRDLELYGRYEEQAYFYRLLKLVGNENKLYIVIWSLPYFGNSLCGESCWYAHVWWKYTLQSAGFLALMYARS